MTLDDLFATIEARKGTDPATSWTAKLMAQGPEKCAEKFGEEAIEAIIEAIKDDKAALTSEAADVLFHLLVMLSARDVPLSDVMAELTSRTQQSGLTEKANRPAKSARLSFWPCIPEEFERQSLSKARPRAGPPPPRIYSLLEITPVAKPPIRNSPNNR